MLNLTKMKLYLKRILVILIILLILSIIVIELGIFLFFDESKVKGLISSCFKKEFDREVIINGNIKLKLFPYLTLDINGLSVAEHKQEFLQSVFVGEVKIKVCLLPCLWNKLEIKEVICKNLDLNIKGKLLADKPVTLELKQDALALNRQKDKKRKFKIDRVDCKHLNIRYDDLQGRKWFVNNLNINLVDVNILNNPSLNLKILQFLGNKGEIALDCLSCNECVLFSNLNILWKNNGKKKFILEEFSGNFGDYGLFKGYGTIDDTVKAKLFFDNVNIHDIKKYNFDWKVAGILNGNVEYTASLSQIDNAQVVGNIKITDVVFGDFSLEREVFKVLTPVLPLSTTVGIVDSNTIINSLVCDFRVSKNRELEIKKLSFQGLKLNGNGMGVIDLSKLHGILQLNLSLQKIPGVMIPLVLSGDLNKLRIKVNLKDFKFSELLKFGIK